MTIGEFDVRDEGIVRVTGCLGVAASLSIARHVVDLVTKGEDLTQGWEL